MREVRRASSFKVSSNAMKERSKRQVKTRETDSAVGDGGAGEVSLSVDETNKLRASLGLKPLVEKKEGEAGELPEETAAKKEKTAEIREKLRRLKEKRQEEEFFAKAKTLGEAGSDSDEDLADWIEKTRASQPESEEQDHKKPQPASKDEDGTDEEPGIAPELVGAKVKHKEEDITVGETMILTLADQPILTEAGNLNTTEDALENALKAEDARRRKAYAASKPKKDEAFDEFGDKKSLLSKYDEEEEEAMRLDAVGELAVASMKPGTSVKAESLETSLKPISDYASGQPPTAEGDRSTKRKRQKLRKKRETGVLDIVAELEATREDAMEWEADHGSRDDRKSKLAQEEQERQVAKEQKAQKFDRALEKANLQALKLKLLEEGDEDDEELYDALNQAQMAASQQTRTRFTQLADNASERKLKAEAPPAPDDKKLVFTDTTEFCRLFSSENADLKRPPSDMEEDTEPDIMEGLKSKPERRRHLRSRTADDDGDVEMKDKEEDPKETGALREPILGTGLATALNTLRDKGDLKEKFEWVGRTNDMKKSRLIGVDDFYTCGEGEDRMEKSIETALTKKDHLGRVLTPKEAFREISYAFHGKGPSQRTLEKRKRKMNEDFLAKRSNLDQEAQLNRLKAVQKVQKNAYVVLSGAEQSGKDVKSKKKKTVKKSKTTAPKDSFPSLTPILDKGDSSAPLEGKKKVEAMLGMQSKE